ncbi:MULTISPECIES: hypothetical protein [unclassified Streptomyces]|uniref:hypothetical protein n=1 Tax=unclassified Streptomyces TaxID=2593676 RepID=UPI002E17939F|nr:MULTISPECIES: hypothetical protein [unclassified Streptomyces]
MATETTDSMTLAVQAMGVMDAHAAQVRAVATQLIAEHSDSLPPLRAVRIEASTRRVHLSLQTFTAADAQQWARALGVTLETPEPDRDLYEHGYFVHTVAEFVVDGVGVMLCSAVWVSTREAVAA